MSQIASLAAFQPGPYLANYYATKAYVLAFSDALAHELSRFNITVTTLCPGTTKTESSIEKVDWKIRIFPEDCSIS
ncbi:MAG: SDR family NAD(P)-dependent oxidoreductase [Gammaproteobacteria bacterium]